MRVYVNDIVKMIIDGPRRKMKWIVEDEEFPVVNLSDKYYTRRLRPYLILNDAYNKITLISYEQIKKYK